MQRVKEEMQLRNTGHKKKVRMKTKTQNGKSQLSLNIDSGSIKEENIGKKQTVSVIILEPLHCLSLPLKHMHVNTHKQTLFAFIFSGTLSPLFVLKCHFRSISCVIKVPTEVQQSGKTSQVTTNTVPPFLLTFG